MYYTTNLPKERIEELLNDEWVKIPAVPEYLLEESEESKSTFRTLEVFELSDEFKHRRDEDKDQNCAIEVAFRAYDVENPAYEAVALVKVPTIMEFERDRVITSSQFAPPEYVYARIIPVLLEIVPSIGLTMQERVIMLESVIQEALEYGLPEAQKNLCEFAERDKKVYEIFKNLWEADKSFRDELIKASAMHIAEDSAYKLVMYNR